MYRSNQNNFDKFKNKLALLDKLETVYQKYPAARNVRLPFEILLESVDPEIQSRVMAGEAFDSIPLPENSRPTEETVLSWTNGDQPLADLILNHSFDFERRKRFVQEQIVAFGTSVETSIENECCCPGCGTIRLGYPAQAMNE